MTSRELRNIVLDDIIWAINLLDELRASTTLQNCSDLDLIKILLDRKDKAQ